MSRSWKAIEATGHFCVNVLHEKQRDVSARFGSKEPDKFAGIDWSPSELGSPIIKDSLAHIDCTVHAVHDGGDHFVVFGNVHSLSEVPKKRPRPLLFYHGGPEQIDALLRKWLSRSCPIRSPAKVRSRLPLRHLDSPSRVLA